MAEGRYKNQSEVNQYKTYNIFVVSAAVSVLMFFIKIFPFLNLGILVQLIVSHFYRI